MSDAVNWPAADQIDTSEWTPESVSVMVSQARSIADLDHILNALQYTRDFIYDRSGYEALQGRLKAGSLMNQVLDVRGQWLQNQVTYADNLATRAGWFQNALLVPPKNYAFGDPDPDEYAAALIAEYGGVSMDDRIARMTSSDPEIANRALQTVFRDSSITADRFKRRDLFEEARQAAAARAEEAAAAAVAANQKAAEAAAQHAGTVTELKHAEGAAVQLQTDSAQEALTNAQVDESIARHNLQTANSEAKAAEQSLTSEAGVIEKKSGLGMLSIGLTLLTLLK